MTKDQIEQKKKELQEWIETQRKFVRDEIATTSFIIDEEDREDLLQQWDKEKYIYVERQLDFLYIQFTDCDGEDTELSIKCQEWYKTLQIDKFHGNLDFMKYDGGYDQYLDQEMKFDGDIIITDPCYIMRAEHHGTKPLFKNDWHACKCGSKMEALEIHNYMTHDTLYGDWNCTTYDLNTKEPIGEFCADAGLVSVFLLDEVLKYNPDFDYHINRKWTTTWIKDFKGTVQFKIYEREYTRSEDFDGYKAGDKYVKHEVEVEGHGINKKTGEKIDFVGRQTGF